MDVDGEISKASKLERIRAVLFYLISTIFRLKKMFELKTSQIHQIVKFLKSFYLVLFIN